jgi:molybdenum cofactor cytidylyltransferase
MISAIVLAAGESKRMGAENKLLLPFEGKPLIEHIVRTVQASDADEVMVVVGHEAERVRAALAGCDVRIVQNEHYREGMTTSIHAGVSAVAAEAEGLMICLSDLPLIEPHELNHLIHAFKQALAEDSAVIAVPVYQGQRGNPVLFAAQYKAEILGHKGLSGCKGVVKQNLNHVRHIEMPTDHILHDIDTQADYRLWGSRKGR